MRMGDKACTEKGRVDLGNLAEESMRESQKTAKQGQE